MTHHAQGYCVCSGSRLILHEETGHGEANDHDNQDDLNDVDVQLQAVLSGRHNEDQRGWWSEEIEGL